MAGNAERFPHRTSQDQESERRPARCARHVRKTRCFQDLGTYPWFNPKQLSARLHTRPARWFPTKDRFYDPRLLAELPAAEVSRQHSPYHMSQFLPSPMRICVRSHLLWPHASTSTAAFRLVPAHLLTPVDNGIDADTIPLVCAI